MSAGDDIEAIKQLKARYFRAMDSKDWAAMAGVFADDVEIDMRGEGGDVTRGVEAFMSYLRAEIETVISVHHGHMPEISLTSATTATGIWAMEDQLWWPAGSPIRHMHGYGHYHDTYVKGSGRWLIKTSTLTRLRRDIS